MDNVPGPDFWDLLHPHTGSLTAAPRTGSGFFTDLTGIVNCEKGPFFVKAMRNRPGGRRDSIVRERAISPFVRSVSPALLWTAENEAWLALGFEVVAGRHADLRPRSPDLPAIAALLNDIRRLPVPDVARNWHVTSFERFAADQREVELLRGDALLHADMNHTNIMIGARAWARHRGVEVRPLGDGPGGGRRRETAQGHDLSHGVSPGLLALIHPYTGGVRDVRPAAGGFGSDFAGVVEGERGDFFVKAVRDSPGWRRTSVVCERAVSPFVRPVAPSLLWAAEGEGWIALGFEVVEGRPARFEVGSPDLPGVVALVNRVGGLGLPDVARGWRERRWDRYAGDGAEAELFRGDTLLHADISPEKVLLGGGGAWVVDWSGSSRGAAFIDPACLVVRLVAAGHEPASAEAWAAGCEAWTNADPRAVDAFAVATARMFADAARRRPEEARFRSMAEAAGSWARHRGAAARRLV